MESQKSNVLKDWEQRKARIVEEGKQRDLIVKAARQERIKRIIEAENRITEEAIRFVKFINQNLSKLMGKKINTKDGHSKVVYDLLKTYIRPEGFETFYLEKSGKRSNLRMRIHIWGGSAQDRTNYNLYIERSVYIMEADNEEGICTEVRADYSYLFYSYDTVIESLSKVEDNYKQIEALKTQIIQLNQNCPSLLRINKD